MRIIHRISYFFNSLKMKYKLSIIFVLLFLISLIIVNSLYNRYYRTNIVSTTKDLFSQTAVSYSQVLDNLIMSVDSIAKAPLYSSQMQSEISGTGNLSSTSQSLLNQAISSLNSSDAHKFIITLYDTDGKILFVKTSSSNSHYASDCYSTALEEGKKANGRTTFFSFTSRTGKNFSVLAKQINSRTDMKPIGLVTVIIPQEVMSSLGSKVSSNPTYNVVLFNEQHNVFFSTYDDDTIGMPHEISTEIAAAKDLTGVDSFETEDYMGYHFEGSHQNYSMLIYSEKEFLFKEINDVWSVTQILLIIVSVFVIVFVFIISSTVSKPLEKISCLMDEVQQGNLDVRFNSKYSDEIGVLGVHFDRMLAEMKVMLKRVAEAEAVKQKVELDALKGQINPHFMYNTLETFRMIALQHKDPELAKLIFSFGKMIRYNISLLNERTTISKEIEYLQYYITIQNCRFDNRIILNVNIDEKLDSTCIIKLLIQPIVENSITHGFDRNGTTPFMIDIYTTQASEDFTIHIHDNGIGISPDHLEEIITSLNTRYLDSTSTKSLGLRNINERIKVFYGTNYGITIESNQARGTTVSIRLPK